MNADSKIYERACMPRDMQQVVVTLTAWTRSIEIPSLAPTNTSGGGSQFRGQFRGRGRGRGFSLVEIMVVLVIIGLLAGLVGINVRGYLVKAKHNAAKTEIATICDALEAFYTEYDRYPSNEEGLLVLTEPSERMPEALLDREPVDPWGRGYVYNQPGRDGPYEVMSLGADGSEGGEPGSADADLGSWDLNERGEESEL